jgi:exonuclease SbcD
LDALDIVFHGQGFRSAAIEDNVVLHYPAARQGAFNIGVLHTSLDLEAGGEHARYAPCTTADLLSRQYDYWALGHVHRRRVAHEDPPIVFPGNTQGRHIRETGAKGGYLVQVDARGRPTLEFQAWDVFRWEELQVSAAEDDGTDELLERIDQALRRAVADQGERPLAVRVVVRGRCRAHAELAAAPEAWAAQVRARALDVAVGEVWVEKILWQTSAPSARPPDPPEGPVRELLAYCEELRNSEQLLAALADELSALGRKLPAELRDETKPGADPLRVESPAYLRQAVDEVEPLLLARLLAGEDAR